MTELHVALLMGGHSAEKEVSLNSGAAVEQALLQLGHRVTVVRELHELRQLGPAAVDVVFNIWHGAEGEDGQLAAWLALEGYRSTCGDFAGACVSWHKDLAKTLVAAAGILTPNSQLLHRMEELAVNGEGPWIVKPATEGSSVGLYKVDDAKQLQQAVSAAFAVTDQVLVEDYIDGQECTVGLVGEVVLPVVSIEPANELYDYQAKYQSQATQYHCPANFAADWQQALQADAQTIYRVLNINGWCRIDFIVDAQGRRWFLEANTTPGMTSTSLLPKAAAVHGWDFTQLVAAILATADNGGQDE
ncbi:D-alanine--D-alanine ligase [Marinicella meishanensis]|uniref:D-alanine--D-alanine ligase n=1 Tax=Marinicella meishanensis TaxID=2873263 RepID=UPI001CBC7D32|nr:D-alanine--D-alanine ligase [Marinicella sp. NBU2979]